MIRRIGLALAMAWLVAAPAAAAPSRLFVEDALLKLTLTAPFPTLVRSARSSTKPYPATLAVSQAGGPEQSIPIQLAARGVTRRTGGYCSFPPLSLAFAKGAAKGTPFHGQRRLKLVTYCNAGRDYEQRVVLEYLSYRIYNLITPMSFRVRKAEVTYRTGPGDQVVTRIGFLIESLDDLARRNGRAPLMAKVNQVSAGQLDQRASARASLFQYMISNLDYEFLAGRTGEDCCHNARLIAAPNAIPGVATGVIPIPYDFDYSGFVDAPYAGVPVEIEQNDGISSVKERLYRGYCASNPEIAKAAAEFRAARGETMSLVNGEPSLTEAFRNRATRFLEGFYAVLDDPAQLERKIVKHCR